MDAEAGGGDAAIRALGSLFRLTEVFLWDDASCGISKSSACHGSSAEEESTGYACSAVSCSYMDLTMDDAASREDLDLAKQMDALGLPTSFKTNKEQRRNTSTRVKRKEMLTKSTFIPQVTGVQAPELSGLGQVIDRISPQVSDGCGNTSLSCIAMHEKNDTSHFDADDTFNEAVLHSDGEPNNQLEEIVKEQIYIKTTDVVAIDSTVCDSDPSRINATWSTEPGITPVDFKFTNFQENAVGDIGFLQCEDGKRICEEGRERNLEDTSSLCCVTEFEETSVEASIDSKPAKCFSDRSTFSNSEEWGIFWDAFYMRNYYYNFHTQESTWYPPLGLEQSALLFTSSEINTNVSEEGAHLAFAWDGNNHQGLSKVTGSSQEVQSDRKVSGEGSQEVMSSLDYATENLISDADVSFLDCSSNNLDEHMGKINFSETNASAEGFSAVQFFTSDTMDRADRLPCASNDTSVEEKWICVSKQEDLVAVPDDLHGTHHLLNRNRRKKVKRIKSRQNVFSGENKDLNSPGNIEGVPASLVKYWYQRYLLFSKLDHGVKMDDEGWFSVTPEAIARHHASRCGHGMVIDCFTGVGGNAIQFAMKSNHVIAIDIDPQKVDYAQHNATIYEVGSNIDFIKGDFFALASNLKADTVFLSPPWGGPDYAKAQVYDIRSMLKPRDGYFLFKIAMKMASTVVMFLPRNVDPNQLAELSLLANPPWQLEVEKNYLNGKLKGITAYFSHRESQEIPDNLDL